VYPAQSRHLRSISVNQFYENDNVRCMLRYAANNAGIAVTS